MPGMGSGTIVTIPSGVVTQATISGLAPGADLNLARRLPPVAGQDGNWTCIQCANVNFAGRRKCHLCQADRNVSQPQAPDSQGDAIDKASTNTLTSVAHLETEWDFDKLRWKVASYFRKAARGVPHTGPVVKIIDEIADSAFATLSGTLGDRTWLPQVDFTMVLDATIKLIVPPEVLFQIPAPELDTAIITAHDRASEQGRSALVMWEVVQGTLSGKKAQSKVYSSLESARIEAVNANVSAALTAMQEATAKEIPSPLEKVQKFIAMWIKRTVVTLADSYDGNPGAAMPQSVAVELFHNLLQRDTLPKSLNNELLMNAQVMPQPYPNLEGMVREVYQPYAGQGVRKGTWQQQPKTELCWFFFNGVCHYMDNCINAHSPLELEPAAAWSKGFKGFNPGGKGMGMDLKGKGMDFAGKGMDLGGKGMDLGGKGMDFGGKGMDFGGKGKDFGGKGMDFGGKGMDFGGKGMDFGGKGMGKGYGGPY